MLAKESQSLVTKTQRTEPDGTRKWYWELRTSQRRARKSSAAVRVDATETAGYQRAVTDMLKRLAIIDGGKGKKLTAKQLMEKFYAELRTMKDES